MLLRSGKMKGQGNLVDPIELIEKPSSLIESVQNMYKNFTKLAQSRKTALYFETKLELLAERNQEFRENHR